MRRRPAMLAVSGTLMLAAGLTGQVAGAQGNAQARPGLHVQSVLRVPAAHLLGRHAGTTSSTNWAGYAVSPAKPVTGVTTEYVQPAFGTVPPGFAVVWAGIGGYNTNDLIQAGTAVNPPGFGPTYSAWIERLPDAEQQITGCVGDKSCGVHPGDRMVVSIRQLRGSSWLITMVDRGHWSWRQTVTYASARSSAEWILEAPSEAALQTTLDGVGEVHFVGSNTFTAGGRTTVIGRGNPDKVTLLEGAEATPSALSRNGSAFNVCAYSFSCPAP